MARNTTTAKIEKRQAEAAQLHETLTHQIEQLRDSDQWLRFLAFAQSFHSYSLNNLLLILAQNPAATKVAGYRSWQKRGRQVRKGEKSIRIFGGREVTITEEDDNGNEKTHKRVRFFPVSVFDITQTEPIDPDVADPHTIAQRLTGEDPHNITTQVADWLAGEGWQFSIEDTGNPELNGYTTIDGTRRVVVNHGMSPAQTAKTALHEAAHVILHADHDLADYIAHRGTAETEAESVAYIVAGLLGLDTSAYSVGYVAGWSNCDTDLVKATAKNALKAAHLLADAFTQPQGEGIAATA
ncbi:ArdC-like ssDNA-binding domain-containing protein [Enemella sp. A6]|uniref:ArdC-like ssDNA-binding domain-containing protein n=1 Tax=Enemella sp. A6 TaxID=3440152 RepID=UPI003EBB1ED3